MKNPTDNRGASNAPRWFRGLAALWRWLIEPSAAVVGTERRLQARVLMAMLLVLITLGLISSLLSLLGIYTPEGQPRIVGSLLDWITLVALVILAVAYGLSRSIYYPWAASLTVGTVLAATFGAVIIGPADIHRVFFLILGGLIASLFLSARITATIFFATFISLFVLPKVVPGFSTSSDVSALFFTATVGGLVVMAAALRQRYLEQIDSQTQQLIESEAQLRELSMRDPLTGLFNRRYLEEVLALEMVRAARKQYPIGIIMADIDHFKQFNDIHGHAAGDAVLIQISNFLRAHVRSTDVTCRYGGEEFILILPEASREITQMRARQMQEDARYLPLQFEGQTLEAVTLSLGIALFPEHGSTYDAILKAVDAALYRAKQDGRDRVLIAE